MRYRRTRTKGGTYFFTVVTYKRNKISIGSEEANEAHIASDNCIAWRLWHISHTQCPFGHFIYPLNSFAQYVHLTTISFSIYSSNEPQTMQFSGEVDSCSGEIITFASVWPDWLFDVAQQLLFWFFKTLSIRLPYNWFVSVLKKLPMSSIPFVKIDCMPCKQSSHQSWYFATALE